MERRVVARLIVPTHLVKQIGHLLVTGKCGDAVPMPDRRGATRIRRAMFEMVVARLCDRVRPRECHRPRPQVRTPG